MSEPRWILELLGGEGRTVELPASGMLVLGSSAERAGFVLEGQGVDETHCAVGRTKEGDWAIKDLGSRHGTLLNGQRVSAARLKLGDQLVLGSRRLEVRPARVQAERAAVQAVGSARPSDAPQRIAGYRIERLIGKGGMGSVYLAVQESLRRPVALKVLAPHLASDRDFVLRFQAEARAAAALSHPNVVVVYDVGEENGAHYLSMEFMAGGSLEQKLASSGPLPWKATLAALGDAAAGLAYAESRGIVHRDIKPANLMYSGTGTVKIADLGLATTIEAEASEAPEGGRKVFGTPHFISPEQARGEPVDHRSDLYSLGATAYRLLSGRTPFEGASTREILRALQSEPPRPLHECVDELPADIEALVSRLMEKAPEDRFPTAEALRRECERLRLVAEHGPTVEVQRGARGQRWLAVALLLVVASASAWFFLLRDRASPPAPPPDVGALDSTPETSLDPSFFQGPGEDGASPEVRDEEELLRAREREAGRALREIPAALSAEDRRRALEGLRTEFAGTKAAEAAEAELAALDPGPAGPSLEDVVARLDSERQLLAQRGASLKEVLEAIEAFRAPPELGEAFEARRAELAASELKRVETALRGRLDDAGALALDGRFDELRGALAALQTEFDGLVDLPGAPERLAGLEALRTELAQRLARVDEEERFYRVNVERAERRAVGEAVGPGSGLLAELEALDLEALERRLDALPPEVRERPLCTTLRTEARLAREALGALRAEFTGGGWRRKSIVDPRARRVREVRDVRPEGLVLDKDGELEPFSWRDAGADPDWWHQLFQARLGRDWKPEEVRAIVALLRLVGATRGALLTREGIDPRARGLLQPSDLEALRGAFGPALEWAGDAAPEVRAALQREREAATRLASALEAAQARAWATAEAHLEVLLARRPDSLLIGLLTDGTEWRLEPAPAPAPAADGAPPKEAPKVGATPETPVAEPPKDGR